MTEKLLALPFFNIDLCAPFLGSNRKQVGTQVERDALHGRRTRLRCRRTLLIKWFPVRVHRQQFDVNIATETVGFLHSFPGGINYELATQMEAARRSLHE